MLRVRKSNSDRNSVPAFQTGMADNRHYVNRGSIATLIRKKQESGSRPPLVQIQFIVFRHNEHEIEKIHALARELGVDGVKIKPGVIGDRDWPPSNNKLRFKKAASDAKRMKTCW